MQINETHQNSHFLLFL